MNIYSAQISDLEKITEYIWLLSQDPKYSGFPKIDSYAKAHKRIEKALSNPSDCVLVYRDAEEINACVILDVEPDNLYLQANGGIFSADTTGRAVREIVQYIMDRFGGYEFLCTHTKENISNSTLEQMGAELIEASRLCELSSGGFVPLRSGKISLLNANDFDAYSEFHSRNFDGCYWSFERMLADMSRWEVHVMMNGSDIVGSSFTSMWDKTMSEIYGLKFIDGFLTMDNINDMLRSVVSSVFNKGRKNLLYAIEDNDELYFEAAMDVGFVVKDCYRCYKI